MNLRIILYRFDRHVGADNVCVPIEDISVGPMRYIPQIMSRHVSTPSLGRSRLMDEVMSTPMRSLHSRSQLRAGDSTFSFPGEGSLSPQSFKNEFTTVFHEHGSKMAIDPNRRYCATPGPLLSHEPILSHIAIDGKYEAPGLSFGLPTMPFGERIETKLALPDYDIKYDSEVVTKRVPMGKILKSIRFKHYEKAHIDSHQKRTQLQIDSVDHGADAAENDVSVCSRDHSRSYASSSLSGQSQIAGYSSNSAKSSLVTKVKIKLKPAPEVPKFAVPRIYSRIKAEDITLTPKLINETVKANLFHKLYAMPRQYHSQHVVPVKIAEKIKNYS